MHLCSSVGCEVVTHTRLDNGSFLQWSVVIHHDTLQGSSTEQAWSFQAGFVGHVPLVCSLPVLDLIEIHKTQPVFHRQ